MKLMIMNYKPYEYELLQEKLNQLGSQGYTTKELELLTFFEKGDKPVYYHIDFHKTFGSSKREREEDKKAFIRKYKQKGLHPIYTKHNMYVFTSKEPKENLINWKEKTDIATGSFKIFSMIAFFISLIALTLFTKYLFHLSFDKFMTYGITIVYIGIIFLLLTGIYRNYMNYHYMSLFHHKIKMNTPHFSHKILRTLRQIYMICFTISLLFILGGMTEDVFNQSSFQPEERHVIQLKDFQITEPTTISTQSYSSFTLPHTYISLEEVKDGEHALYVKEFEFDSQEKAQEKFNKIKKTPNISAANEMKEDRSLLYGYSNNRLVSLTLLHNHSITIIIPTFELTQENIQTITYFYK